MVTAHDMLQELKSFTYIDEDMIEMAQNSNVSTETSQVFQLLVNNWNDGIYDNDPDSLLNEIHYLISK